MCLFNEYIIQSPLNIFFNEVYWNHWYDQGIALEDQANFSVYQSIMVLFLLFPLPYHLFVSLRSIPHTQRESITQTAIKISGVTVNHTEAHIHMTSCSPTTRSSPTYSIILLKIGETIKLKQLSFQSKRCLGDFFLSLQASI